MFELIRSIRDKDAAKPGFFEVFFAYNGFHAVVIHRFNNFLWRLGLRGLARFFSNLGRMITGIEVHPQAEIGRRFFIDHGTGCVIGQTAIIGDDVTIYHGVTLGGVKGREKDGRRHPHVGDRAMIGAGAQVLGGITIGADAKIGANSVVLQDVPENSTVVGNPARLVQVKGKRQKYAYGLTREFEDPYTATIDGILKDLEDLKKKVGADKEESSKAKEESCGDYAERWHGSGI